MAHTEAYRLKKQAARIAKERAKALAFHDTVPGNMVFVYSTFDKDGVEQQHLELFKR